jgi:short-subunit dehydrogenase
MKYDSLADKVVVITGASSGIGKLSVEEFLKEGAKVVLVARSEAEMRQHLSELGVGSDRALVVKTDVSDYRQVKSLADTVLETFGRIDVWVNNAAISLYGTLDLLNPEEISRIIDVNLKGQIYGSKVVFEVFKAQRFGNIIHVTSALGKGSTPLQSIYVATKHGVTGFASSLREELIARRLRDIEVSVVMPSSMDTPLFTHAKSKMGVAPYPIPPIYHPMKTVKTIVNCAKNPKPEVVVGNFGKIMVWAYRLSPILLEQYMGRTAMSQQLSDTPKPVEGNDNLLSPMPGTATTRGGIGTTGEHLMALPKKHPVKVTLALAIPTLTFLVLRRLAARA